MTTVGASRVIVLLLRGGIRIELKYVWYQHEATCFCLHVTKVGFSLGVWYKRIAWRRSEGFFENEARIHRPFIEILVSLRSTIIDCMCYYTAMTSETQSNVKYLPIISLQSAVDLW